MRTLLITFIIQVVDYFLRKVTRKEVKTYEGKLSQPPCATPTREELLAKYGHLAPDNRVSQRMPKGDSNPDESNPD